MSVKGATRTTWKNCARQVMHAIPRLELESLNVPEATRSDSEEYVYGRIDSDEMVRRARWICQR